MQACLQQTPNFTVLQTLFQRQVLLITPTLNAGFRLRCLHHVNGGNTIIVFNSCTNGSKNKPIESLTLLTI
jgi:hypothetical protein